MNKMTRRLIGGIIVGVCVMAAISLYADTAKMGARLSDFAWSTFGLAIALAALNYVVRFARWTLYLRRMDFKVETKLSALIFLSGFALSVTPGKIGELLKSYLLRETKGYPIAQTAPIVIAERVTDLAALLVLGGVGVAVYGVGRTAQSMVMVGVAVVLGALLVLAWERLTYGIIDFVTIPRLLRRFRDRLREFYAGLGDLMRLWPLSWATVLAITAWLAECVGFALIVSGFPGTSISLGLATVIYATTTVAGALSFLPGGLLVTEATMTLFLVQASAGVDEATAVAATILTRLATLWFAVVLGLLALAVLRRYAPEARRALEAAENPDIVQQ